MNSSKRSTPTERKIPLRFSDGVEFDLSGPRRLEYRSDGWYLVGRGFLMAVPSEEVGQKLLEQMGT